MSTLAFRNTLHRTSRYVCPACLSKQLSPSPAAHTRLFSSEANAPQPSPAAADTPKEGSPSRKKTRGPKGAALRRRSLVHDTRRIIGENTKRENAKLIASLQALIDSHSKAPKPAVDLTPSAEVENTPPSPQEPRRKRKGTETRTSTAEPAPPPEHRHDSLYRSLRQQAGRTSADAAAPSVEPRHGMKGASHVRFVSPIEQPEPGREDASLELPPQRRTAGQHIRRVRGKAPSDTKFSDVAGFSTLKQAMRAPRARKETAPPGTLLSDIQTIRADSLKIEAVATTQPPVPGLAHGLERVLFNPGVYHLQDPRSRVYNFDPYLQLIMPVAEFDFNALKQYITASRDESLTAIAAAQRKRYVGSTSSMTGVLAHFHFLLSQWREIDTSTLSQAFPDKLKSFTALQRKPSAIFLRWKDGTYAVDADKGFDTANILSMLGKSMEKLLTLPTDDYERYRKTNTAQVSEHERNSPEPFHYSTMGDFLMRSQLDAHDPRLPGTGMFDVKTRAVVAIRMDAKNYQKGTGYQIKDRHGEWESFEREYFDMIRAAFLKYSLQVRMGRMDGIFVTFHNTERIFGFQYVSLPEMDSTLHGSWDGSIGDQEFKLSLDLLNKVFDKATAKFPEKSLRIHFETRDTKTPFMYVFAEPVTEEEVEEVQNGNKAKIEQFEREVLGLDGPEGDADESPGGRESEGEWGDIQAKVEQEMTHDEDSLAPDAPEPGSAVTTSETDNPHDGAEAEHTEADDVADEEVEAAQDVEESSIAVHDESSAIEDEGRPEPDEHVERAELDEDEGRPKPSEDKGTPEPSEDKGTPEPSEDKGTPEPDKEAESVEDTSDDADEHFLDEVDKEQQGLVPQSQERGLLAMTLAIRNKVNGEYVTRPERLAESDRWAVEYSLSEIKSVSRSWSLYGACQMRRRKALDQEEEDEADVAANYYIRRLHEISRQGRRWRQEQDEVEARGPKVVLHDRRSGGGRDGPEADRGGAERET
ncbi:MAG: hypothetical protein M1832_003102 [Thelocarpon impressellum]|nr:MAG: hypothetical protein M1832_003102 [Thelocarpon impressellum]